MALKWPAAAEQGMETQFLSLSASLTPLYSDVVPCLQSRSSKTKAATWEKEKIDTLGN